MRIVFIIFHTIIHPSNKQTACDGLSQLFYVPGNIPTIYRIKLHRSFG